LSYPTLVTTDNQAARINAGQDVPYISDVTFPTVNSPPVQSVARRQIGVILTVVPRISPEGRVVMRVTPEISSLGQTLNLGNGNVGQVFNVQNVDTTIAANDGETVMIGGLVTKRDSRVENKVPVLGDIPVLGALFRFRSRTQAKTELIVILTPHVVRSKFDADRVLAEHASKMQWNL
jgi:type II secretory pathway component GspD/PulD (secretin)